MLTPLFGAEFVFLPFYLAVIFTTWFAGFAPGIFSILLGFLAANGLVFMHTSYEADSIAVTAYLSLTLTIAFFGKSMHEARRRSEFHAEEAVQRQRDLDARISEIKDEADRRMKAELSLAAASERLNAVFESPGAVVAEVESANGRFSRVSVGFCQLIGYSAEELAKMTLSQVTAQADAEGLRKMIEGQGPETASERRYIAKGGQLVWMSVVAVPIRVLLEQPTHTLMLAHDVTARHQLQEALQSAQQRVRTYVADVERQVAERTASLNLTVRSLDEFCYSISHQLLGPINRVNTNAQVLTEKLPQDSFALEHVRRICKSAGQLNDMVQSLLDYGRLAREPVPLEALHLETIIDHVLTQLAAEIDSTQAKISVQSPIPPVLGHPLFLQKVFLHLLRNAITYVAPKTVPLVSIRAEETASAVRIWIVDNGVGIDAADFDRIFHIFVRLGQSGEYAGGGTGLAIVKKAVERMNGRIGLQSKKGSGSSFWLDLPKAEVNA